MFENYEERKYNLNINIDFTTRTELTKRMIEVSHAFGLGVSEEKHFIIYKDFKLSFNNGDLVYITGDSGGGKSLLLKEIKNRLNEEKCINFDDLTIDSDTVVIDNIGSNLEESVKYLSLMGLNDAFIFIRKYKELSDGQKYRFKLAKMISEKPDFIFIDEFCNNVDRITAKVIAYNLQRTCRDNNITCFVATTHKDLIEDFNPSIIVDKRFMDEVKITYSIPEHKKISFYKDVVFKEGNIEDYKLLSKFHYKTTDSNFPYYKVVVAKYDNDIVGVVVFSPPFLQNRGRNKYFNNKYSTMTSEVTSEINKFFIRGSRYVISPKYRGCGLGQKLTTESLKFISNKRYLEVITAMGKYNPVFDKCGMKRVEISDEEDNSLSKLTEWFKNNNIKFEEINNKRYLKDFIHNLSDDKKKELKEVFCKILIHPKAGIGGKDGKRSAVLEEQERFKSNQFEDLEESILNYIPKLYTGISLYYVMENPYYKEESKLSDFFSVTK